jgi:hypothetical protein
MTDHPSIARALYAAFAAADREATRIDGTRFRNTEVLTFAGEQLRRAEVYFGWDL